MRDERKTEAELLEEISNLRSRVAQLEQANFENEIQTDYDSDDIFQIIFNNAADGILVADLDHKKFHLANSRSCQMLGYSSEEIKSLGVLDIHPEKDLPYVMQQFSKQERGENSLAKDMPVMRKDGSVFYADINALPITLGGKKYLMGVFRDVTDRREAIEHIKMLANFPSENPNPVLRISKDGTINYANEASSTLLNCWKRQKEEKVPENIHNLIEESLKAGKPRLSQLIYSDKIYNLLFVPIQNTDYVNLYGLDITEHKKADDALKKSEETFRLAMEAANDALWDWNIVTNEVYRNPRHATMLGFRPDEMTSSQEEWEKRIHPEDKPKARKLLDDILIKSISDTLELEYRLRTKSGEYIWVLGRGKVVSHGKDGSPLRMVGTNTDITGRKKFEQALKESEERYRSVVEDTPFLLCRFLPGGEIIFVNDTYCKYFDKTSNELVGSNFKYLIPEEDRESVLENISSLTIDSPIMTHEHKVSAPNRQIHWQRWTNRALYDEHGCLVYYQSFGEDITVRKNAEQALKESEEHYKMLAESMNDGLTQVDENGILVYVNSKCAEMLGYTQHEMIGNHWSKFYDDRSRAIIAEQLLLRRKGISEPYEITNIRKDGRKFHIYLSPQPIFDQNGDFRGSFAIMTDITQLKKMEEELYKEKNRLNSILEVMESFVTIRDLDYTIIYQNDSVTKVLGDKIGEKCFFAYEGKDHICEGCPVELAYKDGKSHASEREVKLPSGQTIYLENIANPMRDANGKIYACLEVATNVTGRKIAADALRESEEKYRTLVEGAGEAIATIDENGAFLFMNRTAVKRLGIDPGAYIGKTMWDLFPKPVADGQVADVQKVIKNGQGMNRVTVTELQEKQRWYNTTIEPLKNADGKIIAAMVLARDITEFKRVQLDLEKFKEEMARTEQLASVGTLSAFAAHELTQPLTVIRLLIENVVKKLEISSSREDVTDKLKECLNEVTNITSVVNRLRSFARKSSGKISTEVNLDEIALRIVNMLNETFHQAGFTVRLEGMENLPLVYSNDKDMEQLFFSLVDNALQAKKNKKNRHLIISADTKDGYVELSFSDNCGGIPPENLDRIFEPFFTTKPSGKGTGLGLCIVKDIVSRAGGKIHVESESGKGTTFLITLPVTDTEN
jgi:PAS domain S-box-containing protein